MAGRVITQLLLGVVLPLFGCCDVVAAPQDGNSDDPSKILLPVVAPKLFIDGPPGQVVYVFARYFNDSQLDVGVAYRVAIEDGGTTVDLKPGFNGYHAQVVVPTERRVQVALRDSDEVLVEKSSTSIQKLGLAYGAVPQGDQFDSPRVLLDDSERELLRAFIAAVDTGDTRSIVANDPNANVDWQCLDAYCRVIADNLGDRVTHADADPLDGWLSWQGGMGTRVFSGDLEFERGRCRFLAVALGQELVDIRVDAPMVPEDWFTGPATSEEYETQALDAAKAFFSNLPNVKLRTLFGPAYRNSISEEDIGKLRSALREKHGERPVKTATLRSEYVHYDDVMDSAALHFQLLLSFESNAKVIANVAFSFDCGPTEVGRGQLASVDFAEAWTSAAPQEVAIVERTLTELSNPTNPALKDLHPDVSTILDLPMLQSTLQTLAPQLGTTSESPDFAMWTQRSANAFSTAEGRVEFDNGSTWLRFEFAEDGLLGLTWTGDSALGSTLSLINPSTGDELVGQAEAFWQNLFQRDIQSAHSLLSQEFQARLTLEALQDALEQSGVATAEQPVEIATDQLRLVSRLDRPFPVMVAVYQLVKLAGNKNGSTVQSDSVVPVRCEFRYAEQDTGWEMVTFNTDFVSAFPCSPPQPDDSAALAGLIDAFQSGSATQLIQLMRPRDRELVQPEILDAFLKRLRAGLDAAVETRRVGWSHIYEKGTRVERVRCDLAVGDRFIPLKADFELGRLRRFDIGDESLVGFAKEVDEPQCFIAIVEQFGKEWMAGDSSANQYMVNDLQRPATIAQLKRLRDATLFELGARQSLTVSAPVFSETKNQVTLDLELVFTDGRKVFQITLDVDAFSSRISAVDEKK